MGSERNGLQIVDQSVDEAGQCDAVVVGPVGQHLGHLFVADGDDAPIDGASGLGETDHAHPTVVRVGGTGHVAVVLEGTDMPPVTGVQLQAGFTGGLLTLTEFGATWQGGTVKATGTVPVTLLGESLPAGYLASLPSLPDRAAATIRLDSVTAAMAAPFVDAATLAQVEGALAATITVEATSLAPESVTAAVTFDRAELLIAGEPLKQDRPTRLRLADGQFDIVDWTWSGKGNSLAISGGARLLGDRPELNAALRGTLDLRMLGVASPDVAAGGRADFDIRAVGRAGRSRHRRRDHVSRRRAGDARSAARRHRPGRRDRADEGPDSLRRFPRLGQRRHDATVG